jgi:hypothetical protein
MNVKSLLAIFLFTSMALAGSAQTVYHFTYPVIKPGIIKEEAFFVRHDDGTGFARILSGTSLKELTLQEEFPGSATGNPEYSSLYYKVTGAKNIPGGISNAQTPVFWFKRNTAAEQPYEPWGVKDIPGESSSGLSDFSSPPRVLQMQELKKNRDFVLRFFKPEDVFYKNLFVIKSKGLNAEEAKTVIHLLVLASTNDKTIGPSCKKDMDRMVQTFNDLAVSMGIACKPKTISGTEISKARLEKEIGLLQPAPRDIVVFYYSGHGFRKPKDNRRFPYIDLRSNPNEDYMVASKNMEDIFNDLKAKPGRLKLVLSDCCNTLVDATNAISSPIPNPKGFGLLLNELNYRALFFDPKPTALLLNAAGPGERATSNNEFGGFFSYFFKVSLQTSCGFYRNNVGWNQVFEEAKRNTIYKAEHTYCDKPYIPENICEQTPIIK